MSATLCLEFSALSLSSDLAACLDQRAEQDAPAGGARRDARREARVRRVAQARRRDGLRSELADLSAGPKFSAGTDLATSVENEIVLKTHDGHCL